MNEAEVFVLADRALAAVVARIRPEQWDMTMPPTFARRGSDDVPTLRAIVNYHAYDDAWVPDMLAGRTMEEAGATKFDGDLLGDTPVAALRGDRRRRLCRRVRRDRLRRGGPPVLRRLHRPGVLLADQLVPRPAGARHRQGDRGRPRPAARARPGHLGRGVPACGGVAHHRRLPGGVPVPDDAPLLDRLLGLTGRDPDGA